MTTLRQTLLDRSNDYTALETHYREITGTDLVVQPWESFGRGPAKLKTSASVLIGSYNSAKTLHQSLASLEASTFNLDYRDRFQVIVVDDGSTDDTRDVVCGVKRNLHVIYVKQHHAGLTRAHNTGLAFASHDVIIFSDSDMVHLSCAIEELVKRHEVLDRVMLVGFRFEIDPGDPRLAPGRLRQALPRLRPAFYGDFRLSFPGRPDNMCRATRHFKDFGHGRSLMMANGASYNLPAMTVGAFMSLRRSDYLAMGGSDERLVGWGCEDSTIGARAIALGNFIVPVYSAASGHVSHPRRTPGEHGEFASNVATAARILDEPFETRDAPLDAYRARAIEVIELKPSGRGRKSDARRGVSPPRSAEDHSETGLCHYQVGNFQLASECYAEAARIRADVTWYHLGRAKSLRELGHVDESFAAFDDALRVDGSNCWAHYELGITRARCGDYAGAGQSMRRARELAPTAFDFGWALDTSSTEHKRRGNHHAGQSLHTVAIQDFDLALVADETNCWAHFDRAISMRALDRHHEALAGLARTDALLHPADGNRTWVHAALGRTSMDVGRVNEAKIQLERALELWPANTAAAADLRALHAAGAQRYQLDGSHPVVDAAREIEGWLSDGEGELLAAVTRAATCRVEGPPAAIVEVGSYCGKSTVVIGAALKALRSPVRFYAIDPHQGYDFGRHPDTFEIFTENIRRANVDDRVDVIRARSTDVKSPQPIALLYVDGLHDYASVLADFRHFASDLLPGALVAFHDYFDLCPGVKQCVNELMRNGQCEFVTQRDSLIVCRIPHLENGSVGSHPGDY